MAWHKRRQAGLRLQSKSYGNAARRVQPLGLTVRPQSDFLQPARSGRGARPLVSGGNLESSWRQRDQSRLSACLREDMERSEFHPGQLWRRRGKPEYVSRLARRQLWMGKVD